MSGLPQLALSSMWHQRFASPNDLCAFFEAGRAMGFARFELSHDVPPAGLATVKASGATITTIHHPCPRPAEYDPRDHAFSPDPARRARWTAGMLATITTARTIGATTVVVHAGALDDEALRRSAFELTSRVRAGQRPLEAASRARVVRAHVIDRLVALQEERLDGARVALEPVIAAAAAAGVRVGLETGYHAWEAPTAGGMLQLLDALDPASTVLGAWLDTGHTAARVRVGLERWRDWRDAVDGRWIGAHFHDVVGLRDHLQPGIGELDFAALGAWLPESAARTLEIDWYFEPREVVAGARALAKSGCAAFNSSGR